MVKVQGKHFRSIWREGNQLGFNIVDQTCLPNSFSVIEITSVDEAANAISTMQVRGAPLIGATAAYGMALAMHLDPSDKSIQNNYQKLLDTRPTAINLKWALDKMRAALLPLGKEKREKAAFDEALWIADDDVANCSAIGDHGLGIIRHLAGESSNNKTDPINILTHCNAGWLATVDWGTALAPIYKAHDAGIDVHVWVDETRPRNQGASLTAWELGRHGVPHTVIVDNTGGHLMQHGMVDMCIVGSDRTTREGDVCNKIGTYLKALAAKDNDVPFYVALPYSTIDWTLRDGVLEIPIEQRDPREITHITRGDSTVALMPEDTMVANYGFDVTPARLVTGLITERGICAASEEGLVALYPENA